MTDTPIERIILALAAGPGTVATVTIDTRLPVEIARAGLRRLCELGLARARLDGDGPVYRLVRPDIGLADVKVAEETINKAERDRRAA